MACIVKLKENTYIEWSKASDSPASKIMDIDKLKDHLREVFKVEGLLKNKPISPQEVEIKITNLIKVIEETGTSDSGGAVDLDFILKYNRAGANEQRLSLEEILKTFTS